MLGKFRKSNYRDGLKEQPNFVNIFLWKYFFLYEIPNSKGEKYIPKWNGTENSVQFTRLDEHVNFVLMIVKNYVYSTIILIDNLRAWVLQ